MDWLQTVILALIQGLTEFLPISSSAHLILPAQIFGWPDQGLAFDVAVHVGSLVAVVIYFRAEVISMTRAWFSSIPHINSSKPFEGDAKLAWAVVLGTIPVGIFGLLLQSFIEENFRSAFVIAIATIGFGLLLWIVDKRKDNQRDEYSLRFKDVMIVGCAQAIALIPGTSRSGITMTAGVMLGLTRVAATRFSFLLSIPVISLAGLMLVIELLQTSAPVDWPKLAMGMGIATLSAYACISLFLSMIEKMGFLPFVIYRMVLGVVLLMLIGV